MSLTAASRRSTRRTRLVAAAIAMPLAFGSVLTGCSSGQITQTAEKRPGVAGAQATLGHLSVLNAFIAAPPADKYKAGDTAQIEMVVTSQGDADEITKITLDGEEADIIKSDSAGASSSAAPSSGAPASGSGAAGGGASIEIPAKGHVYFSEQGGEANIEVSMPIEAYPSKLIPLTITFAKAGEVTFNIPVAAPLDQIERDDSQKYTPKEGEGGGH